MIECKKVTTADSLNAPVITFFDIISGSNVVGARDPVIVEARATDPMGEDLAYSMYPGFSGLFGGSTQSIGRIEIAGTYKYGVWVMNESHLTSFAKLELTFTEPVSVESQAPKVFKLYQNSPNPFNPSTTIDFTVPEKSHVVLKIYNMAGQEIEDLKNEIMAAGSHTAIWNAEGLPSGIYFCTVKAGKFAETKKLTLVK